MVYFKRIVINILDKIRARQLKFYRDRLSLSNFSIISSDCIGGVLYHDLGLEFTSPTINLFFNNEDYSFLNLVLDPDFYFERPLSFIESQSYPKAKIIGDANHKDVVIKFVHYKTQTEAEQAWNRRVERLCQNKIIIYLKFVLDEEDINLIDRINYPIFVITSNKTSKNLLSNNKVHVSKYLSKLKENNGRIMSYHGLTGKRNYDDLNIFDFIIKHTR